MKDAMDKITFENSRDILIQLKQDLEKKGYLKVEDGAIYVEPDNIISDHQKGERKKPKREA